MYTQEQEYAKIGRVTVDIKGKSYRLRFTYPEGHRNEFSIARVSSEGWTTAIKAAQLISRDIDLGDFDDTYARYSPKHAKKLQLMQAKVNKEYNLKELWERYKSLNKNRIAVTTQNKLWKQFDNRWVNNVPEYLLELSKAQEYIAYMLDNFADSTVKMQVRTCLNPCVNQAVEAELILVNPYKKIDLHKDVTSTPECFEPNEVREIIDCFHGNTFMTNGDRYERRYYAPMVEFLALAGCRPSECHALTWEDVKVNNSKVQIKFSKAYVKGILKGTKTRTVRLFPCNEQLKALITNTPKIDNPNNLVFPSFEGNYIDQGNFRARHWKPVIDGLVAQGKLEKYLKPYCLRHSFITRLIREGVDIATVASLVGNSPKVILDKYLAVKRDFDLPEL
ncbi:MAG: tyrosine-type recombinase/integrase [Pleurocapsa sp.]